MTLHSLFRSSSTSLLWLLARGGAASLARAADVTQIAVNGAIRGISSSGISSSWNYNPHVLPEAQLPSVDIIPAHDIETGLPEVNVWLRAATGTNRCNKMRKVGVTPCQISSLPGNRCITLALDSRDAARLVRQYGRNGLLAQVLKLNIYEQRPAAAAVEQLEQQAGEQVGFEQQAFSGSSSAPQQQQQQQQQSGSSSSTGPSNNSQLSSSSSDPSSSSSSGDPSSSTSSSSSAAQQQQQPLLSVRVLPKLVHIQSVSYQVENFDFMFCPRDRWVKVNVPVKLWNNDVSPGVKAGGWLHVVNRTVPILAWGWAVRPFFELDMRHMRTKDVLRFRDVVLPEGCQLHARDPMQPVVRCAARVGGE